MNNKLPAFQFYPADWRKDLGVQSLSFHDRGVWIEILCLMHESPERGKLMLKTGVPMPMEALARILGLELLLNQNSTTQDKQNPTTDLTTTLTNLLSYGVAELEEGTGALINRRMVRDEELRKIRQNCGKMGGNPVLVNQNSTTHLKQKSTTRLKQIPTPSSSSSSSSSDKIVEGERNGHGFKKPTIEEVKAFCAEQGLTENDASAFYDGKEANGWRNGQVKIRDWKATVRSWKAAGYHPSQKAIKSNGVNRNIGTCNKPERYAGL